MYVCTEKAAIQEWLKEIEQLKKDKELLLSDYKGLLKDKRELEKENKLLKARNEELNENCYGLAKENKELKIELGMYQSLFKDKIEPYGCGIWEKVTEEDIEKAIKKYLNTNQNKMRKDIDYWDIIFHRCEWCKDHQLGDERTLENYMRLTRIINSMDDEGFSRDETEYEDIWG